MPVSRASIRRLGGGGGKCGTLVPDTTVHWLKAETSTVFSLQKAVVRQVHAADQPPSDSRGTHHSASLQSAQCREAVCAVPPTDGIPVPPFADLLPASAWCHLCTECRAVQMCTVPCRLHTMPQCSSIPPAHHPPLPSSSLPCQPGLRHFNAS